MVWINLIDGARDLRNVATAYVNFTNAVSNFV